MLVSWATNSISFVRDQIYEKNIFKDRIKTIPSNSTTVYLLFVIPEKPHKKPRDRVNG